jgi:hypothetical protein
MLTMTDRSSMHPSIITTTDAHHDRPRQREYKEAAPSQQHPTGVHRDHPRSFSSRPTTDAHHDQSPAHWQNQSSLVVKHTPLRRRRCSCTPAPSIMEATARTCCIAPHQGGPPHQSAPHSTSAAKGPVDHATCGLLCSPRSSRCTSRAAHH